MAIIRCTKKLQKEMGLRDLGDAGEGAGDSAISAVSPMGAWHANLIYITRRKCVLFTNDQTLYNFLAPDVSRKDVRELDQLFLSYLSCVLNEEDLPEEVVAAILKECASATYAKSNSRSVLGSMNEFAFIYELRIRDLGSIHHYMVPSIMKDLNRMPMGALKNDRPINAVKAAYGV